MNRARPPLRLTPARQRVLDLLAEAYGPAAIAARLGVSVHTVERHVEDIAQALPSDFADGYQRRERVIFWAMRHHAEQMAQQARAA
jgi:DNA-binding NarL/FixJ family response regulator